jgi:hypothetical protein
VASPRVVLVEHLPAHTANIYDVAWSSPALRRIQEEVGPENVIVLAYHRTIQGSAATIVDPFDNQASVDRHSYYDCCTNWPTTWFSGLYEIKNTGQRSVEEFYDRYKPEYDSVKRTMSPVQISLTGAITMTADDESTAEVQATITATDHIRGKYRIWFVLSEDGIMAPGRVDLNEWQMTRFDWIVRDVLPNELLTISQAGQQQMVGRSVMLDPAWKRENLNLTVFVQKDPGYEVLQAAAVDLPPPES